MRRFVPAPRDVFYRSEDQLKISLAATANMLSTGIKQMKLARREKLYRSLLSIVVGQMDSDDNSIG